MPNTIRVLIADDSDDLSDVLISLIDREPGFFCAGRVKRADEVAKSARDNNANVVILDIRLTGGGGISAIEPLRQLSPKTKVVIHSAGADPHVLVEAKKLGATAIITKGSDMELFFQTLRAAAEEA